jgi:hypothetical protein
MPNVVSSPAIGLRWRRLLRLSAMIAGVVAIVAGPRAATTLATYQLGAGWATFGIALPAGAARTAVRVGTLPTQTDVKTTWPDGSIRFAIVTTRVAAAGTYAIVEAPADRARFDPVWPAASVRLAIGKTMCVADLRPPTSDVWLAGPLVVEGRFMATPVCDGKPHPFLRVVFDVRSYAPSGSRIDVTVENTLDIAAADRIAYDVTVNVGERLVFEKRGVDQAYLTRWRKVFAIGVDEAGIIPDFASAVQAHAIPAYLDTVVDGDVRTSGPAFDILQIGALHDPMNDHGGRPELAPYPDWAAQYLVHKRSAQRAGVLRHGDLAGSYSMHVREADGVHLISIDEHPNYWLDVRADPDGRPKNGLRGTGYRADIAHQPSLAYLPYLLTGDRYYIDEMKFWANYCLIGTYQDGYYNSRRGRMGLLLDPNEVRGTGWAVRNLADTAAYLPDHDPDRAYFRAKLQNNLDALDAYARQFQTPLGTLWTGKRPEDNDKPPYTWIAPWEHNQLAWAIDRAAQQGFSGGAVLRDRVARFQLRLYTGDREGYPRQYGTAYVLAIGTRDGKAYQYFTSLAEVLHATYGTPTGTPDKPAGYVGVQARLALVIAEREGMPGAREAYDYLMSFRGSDGSAMVRDVNERAGWAVAREADFHQSSR